MVWFVRRDHERFSDRPQNLDREGSYGRDGSGAERPTAGNNACLAVQDSSCP